MTPNTPAKHADHGAAPPQPNCGCYVLILRLPEDTTSSVGSLGSINFDEGRYAYVGRAKKNLAQRIARHFRGSSRRRWHVDYLRRYAAVESVYVSASLDECAIAARIAAFPGSEVVPRFGSSDCRCRGHLIRLASGMPRLDGLNEFNIKGPSGC